MSTLVCSTVRRVFGFGPRRRVAVSGISFRANAGEILGIIGPNGAGKTTLLRLITGDLALTSGVLHVASRRAGTLGARRAVGQAPDPTLAPGELTGLELLRYFACHRAPSLTASERLVAEVIEMAELSTFVTRRIGSYSRGMTQRLALAAAVINGPTVLVLDEVLSGTDPLVLGRLRDRIADLAGHGRLVLIASHDLATVERLATRVLVLFRGRLLADVATSVFLSARVAELSFANPAAPALERFLRRYPGARRTPTGVAVPLTRGLTVEQLLAASRGDRLVVAASCVRYRALEDLLLAAERADP